MKKLLNNGVIPVLVLTVLFTFLTACSNDNDEVNIDTNDEVNIDKIDQTLTDDDIAALLFMLEEEKLARDTYSYLDNLWAINQFTNIKNSEQTHMNAVENLLIQYNIAYNILPVGEFTDQDLQNYYNQFVIDGAVSKSNAFQIGATIEDLDIVDLQNNLNQTKNTTIIAVFESLQCGSRNHLRSFVKGLENIGDNYTPQFLSQNEYDRIIEGSQEKCN
jgi:hypothetical protein